MGFRTALWFVAFYPSCIFVVISFFLIIPGVILISMEPNYDIENIMNNDCMVKTEVI